MILQFLMGLPNFNNITEFYFIMIILKLERLKFHFSLSILLIEILLIF